ncbi:hypothetical protein EX30DRAFT_372669 [Ascodesmis nigricans]|uniref:Uncharacterized protein n=1 Tax=Ascodesmis nigricans TaxID=341454 RepID=A0A4S2MTV4_9PEZI|nr:hypothetical protein EX30DRAFT_372669 [Ascodesmis nigricans]
MTISAPTSINFTVGANISGFDNIKVDPTTPRLDASHIGVNAAAFAQPVFSIGFNLMNKFNLEAALQFRLPVMNVNVTAVRNVDGACSPEVDPTRKEHAIAIGSAIAIELRLVVEDNTAGEETVFDKKLWGRRGRWRICVFDRIMGLLHRKVQKRKRR